MPTTKQNLLEHAVQRFGLEQIAGELRSPPHLVQAWISGHATMPDRKLLALAEFMDRVSGPED